MDNKRKKVTEKVKKDYVSIYGNLRCIVTECPVAASVVWAHLDDNRQNSQACNILRLESGLNTTLENASRGRHDLSFDLNPEVLIQRSIYNAKRGLFGSAYGCARLATYVACPALKHGEYRQKQPNDLSIGIRAATRALANSRVIGRVDLATDVLQRDVLKILAINSRCRLIEPAYLADLITQIGGFYRDQNDFRTDGLLEEFSKLLVGNGSSTGTLQSSVRLRNAAIRDITHAPNHSAEVLQQALEIAESQPGTEGRAQRVWLARALLGQRNLEGSSKEIHSVYMGEGEKISPEIRSSGEIKGALLGSFTWQTLVEGLLVQATTLYQKGGRYCNEADEYWETAYQVIRESRILPTAALGDLVLIPFSNWLNKADRTIPSRMKISSDYEKCASEVTNEILRQYRT